MIVCPECEKKGCPSCDKTGEIRLTECPIVYAGSETFEVLTFAELAKSGLPPVHGGALDQTLSFIQACRMIWPVLDAEKAQRLF
jgi:hypothetical protein